MHMAVASHNKQIIIHRWRDGFVNEGGENNAMQFTFGSLTSSVVFAITHEIRTRARASWLACLLDSIILH